MNPSSFREKIEKGKKVFSDFGYNIVATIITTVVLQIIVYPYLATSFSADVYGQLLTIMGIANIFAVSLGGGLNNVRLIQKDLYEEQKVTGDYNLLLLIFSSISTVIFGIVVMVQFKISGGTLILLLFYVLIGIIENYWAVAYRIVINYKANLIYNIILSAGYLAGIIFARKTESWAIAFVLGEVFGLLYLLKSTSLYKEKFGITPLFLQTTKVYSVLIGTSLIANIVNYLDRIFLYPILGGEQVTIYTVSSFVGKSVGLLITPMAGVLLSYYAQRTFRMTIKKYWIINGITLIGGGIIGVFAIFIAPWITGLLYPTVIENANGYLVIANIASLAGALTNILSPSVLKYANIFWQIVIQIMYAIAYMGLGYIFMIHYGLFGFCIATLLVNLIRMFLLMIIGHVSIQRRERL